MAKTEWYQAMIFWPEHMNVSGYARAYSSEGSGADLHSVAEFFAYNARERGMSRENGFQYKVWLCTKEPVDIETLPEPTPYVEEEDEE